MVRGVVGRCGVTVLLRVARDEEHVSEDVTVQLLRMVEICVMDLILKLLNALRKIVHVWICISCLLITSSYSQNTRNVLTALHRLIRFVSNFFHES